MVCYQRWEGHARIRTTRIRPKANHHAIFWSNGLQGLLELDEGAVSAHSGQPLHTARPVQPTSGTRGFLKASASVLNQFWHPLPSHHPCFDQQRLRTPGQTSDGSTAHHLGGRPDHDDRVAVRPQFEAITDMLPGAGLTPASVCKTAHMRLPQRETEAFIPIGTPVQIFGSDRKPHSIRKRRPQPAGIA